MTDADAQAVKVRFAPSPTGELHLGGARTALYNFLFATQQGGELLLRIEDTDQKRFVAGSMDRFFEDLKWLGIDFDAEPVIQSKNVDRHREVAEELVAKGAAYYEAVSSTKHGMKHDDDEYRKGRGVYRGKNRDRKEPPASSTSEESSSADSAHLRGDPGGLGYVIRLKVPESGLVTVDDAVRGKVTFDLNTVDDAVLIKSDGMPTYHLAAMVDDHDMGITHVFRSEEWLPSTPKHLIIIDAMGWERPTFVHLPLLLATDGKKLSKRVHGEAVWLKTYRDKGYLPEALVNYLALLGWNPGGDKELMSHVELVQLFSLERVHKAGAKFDEAKLDAFQQHYVGQLSVEELVERVKPYVPETVRSSSTSEESLRATSEVFPSLEKLATVVQGRLGKLSEFQSLVEYFYELPDYDDSLLIFKKSDTDATCKGLQSALDQLYQAGDETWADEEILSQVLERVVASSGLSNGDVFWPVRVALTGQERSPSPAECLWVLGKTESLERIEQALEKLEDVKF